MLLSIILLVLLALIAYFHYAQGLFAATISAACAGVAALMAFSYHETIVARYTGGAMAAYGNAVVLVGVFALIYLVLRVVIDNFLPGNVRYPVMMDKIGAPIMGLIAGFFATAIVAIAAQELPFGPTVALYSPYPVEDEEMEVPRMLAPMYAIPAGEQVWNESQLQVARLDTAAAQEQRQELWVPVDKWFIGLVSSLSDQGSLAGRPLEQVYPDFKTAMFGHRLGMQRGATQVAMNLAEDRQDVSVPAVFFATTEGDSAQFPQGLKQAPGEIGEERKADLWLRPASGKTLLVVRLQFDRNAADIGGYVRFSPATARLVIAGKQYYPLATLDSGEVAVSHLPDDFLLAESGADLVYEVDTASAIANESELAEPAFLEFKRFGRVDLGGRRIFSVVTKSPLTHVLRKYAVQELIGARIRERGGVDRSSRDAFFELRNSVPEEPEDPETAEQGAQGDGGAETQPSGGDAEGGSPLDQIRGEAERRNDAIGGGGSPD